MTDLYADALSRFDDVYTRARDASAHDHTAMNLATVGVDGRPASRMVLLKGFDSQGFVFYGNLESRKGVELTAHPYAALCWYWPEIYQQVRVEGRVEGVSAAEADAYFTSRDRLSQLGAWASDQSRALARREDLEARLREYEQRFEGVAVPRPPHWSGFRLRPERVEFWVGMTGRLHERTLYWLEDGRWRKGLLNP